MKQENAKKISESKLSLSRKTLIFEIARARNTVTSRLPSGEFFGVYIVYSSGVSYLRELTGQLNRDGFKTKVSFTDDKRGYSVLEISWDSEFVPNTLPPNS